MCVHITNYNFSFVTFEYRVTKCSAVETSANRLDRLFIRKEDIHSSYKWQFP